MTLSPYDRIAEKWAAARSSALQPKERPFVDTLLEGMPPRMRILELGCGTGQPIASHLLGRGHHITAVDESSRLLDHAMMNLPTCNVIEADIATFETSERFHAVVCWDVLFHISREHHAAILKRMHNWLLPGGRIMITSGGLDSDHPPFSDVMFDQTFNYDSHPTGVMRSLVEQAGFDILKSELIDKPQPQPSREKGRLAIVATKRSWF